MAEKNLGRRDKRKEARLAKNQRKHQAWIEHKVEEIVVVSSILSFMSFVNCS